MRESDWMGAPLTPPASLVCLTPVTPSGLLWSLALASVVVGGAAVGGLLEAASTAVLHGGCSAMSCCFAVSVWGSRKHGAGEEGGVERMGGTAPSVRPLELEGGAGLAEAEVGRGGVCRGARSDRAPCAPCTGIVLATRTNMAELLRLRLGELCLTDRELLTRG